MIMRISAELAGVAALPPSVVKAYFRNLGDVISENVLQIPTRPIILYYKMGLWPKNGKAVL